MNQTTALAWTLLLETPAALLAAHRWRLSWLHAGCAALLASCITHPLAWDAALALHPEHYFVGWLCIEAAVVLAEAGIFFLLLRLSPARALALSLAANSISALAGTLVDW